MPGDLEGSGDSPCYLGQYKRLLILNGSVGILGLSLANIQRLQSMCRCISQEKGGTPSQLASQPASQCYLFQGVPYFHRQFTAMNQLPTLTLQPSCFVSSAPEMSGTSISPNGCYQYCPSRLQHCCVLTWPRLWFRRKGNSVEQKTAFLLCALKEKILKHQIEALEVQVIRFDWPCAISKRNQHFIDKILFHFSIAENQ